VAKVDEINESFRFAATWDSEAELPIESWFRIGMVREVPAPLPMPVGVHLNLGAGNKKIGDAIPYDLEHGWNANTERIPHEPESVAGIWANHFLEHVAYPVTVLRECERVLEIGGVLNVVVPHAMSQLYAADLTHPYNHHFTEETWRHLIGNRYFTAPTGTHWDLYVHTCFIMGISWANLALFTQLVKGDGSDA
jgi:SAM-dependent methyltransferase